MLSVGDLNTRTTIPRWRTAAISAVCDLFVCLFILNQIILRIAELFAPNTQGEVFVPSLEPFQMSRSKVKVTTDKFPPN